MAGRDLASDCKRFIEKGGILNIEEVKIKIFADGADLNGMKDMYQKPWISGFTTNPSLMKKAGVSDYSEFSRQVVEAIPDKPLSFEVFSDDFGKMAEEARIIHSWGKNVFIKIPVMNTLGQSSALLIRKLSEEGMALNVTAVLTPEQVEEVVSVFAPGTHNIVSVFAGRIADTGVDPQPIIRKSVELCQRKSDTEVLWASCRELFNIIQAQNCGADIITVTNAILNKVPMLGKDLFQLSKETVEMFSRDGKSLGYSIHK